MNRSIAAALAALLVTGATVAGAQAPVVASGIVADEAGKAALLARLRALYGARVVDQLTVGPVAAPADWNAQVQQLLGEHLRQISAGRLSIEGNQVDLRGNVASDAIRQQIGARFAASLASAYVLNNGLRVAAPPQGAQGALDQALAERIIEFESGKATLAESGKRILDQMADVLLRMPDQPVRVIGHTDNVGARASNLTLSQGRAEAVKAYLVGRGVRAATIATAGEGPDRPLADNVTAQGRARNRRIEFKVLPVPVAQVAPLPQAPN